MCYNEKNKEDTMLTKEEQASVYHAYQETVKLTEGAKSFMHIKFKEFCEMYAFATENIRGYLSKMPIKGKKILTVTASGDHLINLALAGATTVHNFDINRNVYFMTQLKLAALKTLSYEEYLLFFTACKDSREEYYGLVPIQKKIDENPQVLDYKTYLRIRENLKEDCALYWDMLYEEYHFNGVSLMKSGIIRGVDRTSAVFNNLYLQNEKNYNQARECIDKVDTKYFAMDVLELHKLEDTYDSIILSNIYEYVTDEWYGGISENAFTQYVTEELSKNLNPGGVISIAYQYHYKTKNQAYKPSLKNLFKGRYAIDRREALEKFKFKKILVPSVVREYRNNAEKDCIYLYEEGKTK